MPVLMIPNISVRCDVYSNDLFRFYGTCHTSQLQATVLLCVILFSIFSFLRRSLTTAISIRR